MFHGGGGVFEIGRERVLWGSMGYTHKFGSSSSRKWDITKVFCFYFFKFSMTLKQLCSLREITLIIIENNNQEKSLMTGAHK